MGSIPAWIDYSVVFFQGFLRTVKRMSGKPGTSPTKSQCRLSVQVGIKRTSCRNIIKQVLHLYPYKFTVVHALERPDEPSRVEFCLWFLSEVESGLLDNQFFISSDEAWFSLSGGSWPHVSAATMQWYADNHVYRLDWPAQSSDLNPIEHLWDELDRRLRSREMRPTYVVQLSAMLQEEWRRIPVDILHKLVESMPDRMAAVISTRGGTTRF
ncbi:hypothetical protein ANN_14349 [Periplaneta americana]|uniref:Tc1-like transposase DDE domain-containing protein n=1 Tax=Periplaneta americana TaxID=6978 RepID=A0ABQ8SW20_PERAM|nr:hypothetical protein ANN_14349 [Periplaneta americana]